MAAKTFIAVGENIHCTRIYKVGGKHVKALQSGQNVIAYQEEGQERHLPIPDRFVSASDWSNGRVKHAAVAMWQGLHGEAAGREAGVAYLHHMVREQEAHGARFLDLNVDEFSTDTAQRAELSVWAAEVLQQVSTVPLSIDSSNLEILRAGLGACDPSKGRPMVNSVSLERKEAIKLARQHGAAVIAGASGETSMPDSREERVENCARLMSLLTGAGIGAADVYLDPLVFPVSVNPANGLTVLETIQELRERYGSGIHFAPGLSNISYGMPNRRLINQVFTWLCMERGLDGGIVDPLQINLQALEALDRDSEPFRITRDFLEGKDQFGMAYIAAAREGRL